MKTGRSGRRVSLFARVYLLIIFWICYKPLFAVTACGVSVHVGGAEKAGPAAAKTGI